MRGKMKVLVLTLVALLGLTVAEDIFSYDGYKVYRVTATTSKEIDLIGELRNDDDFDFWSVHRIPSVPMDVMISPEAQTRFETFLKSYGIAHEILINNFEEKVQAERERQKRARRVTRGEVSFTDYMRHGEIEDYLNQLATDYPDIVKTEIIGRSFEGRNLTIVTISSGGSNKPTIFADAGIHAREWAAPSMALYIINQLVENATNAHLYANVDWVLIPVANPDGYEFTHTSTRMWRKTRSAASICFGADPNRNFGYHWGESGSSTWQCSDTFAGRDAFSEVETQALRNYLLAHAHHIKLYIAIHSYGNWVLYPWSYAYLYPENAEELQIVGDLVNDAIFAWSGTNYTVGNSADLLYTSAGCSDDYAMSIGINLSYTLELPGGGAQGFDLPPEDILRTVEETWEGFKAYHRYVEDTYVNLND